MLYLGLYLNSKQEKTFYHKGRNFLSANEFIFTFDSAKYKMITSNFLINEQKKAAVFSFCDELNITRFKWLV